MQTSTPTADETKKYLEGKVDADFGDAYLNLFLGVSLLLTTPAALYFLYEDAKPSAAGQIVSGVVAGFMAIWGLGQIIKGSVRLILQMRATTMIYQKYVAARFAKVVPPLSSSSE